MASANSRPDKRNWVSLVPYGLNQQHPNAYKDILGTLWENRDSLGYAWRILKDGCCDGCALGTRGMYDWTMQGVHLCAVRLQLLRALSPGRTRQTSVTRLIASAQPTGELRLSEKRARAFSMAVAICWWIVA